MKTFEDWMNGGGPIYMIDNGVKTFVYFGRPESDKRIYKSYVDFDGVSSAWFYTHDAEKFFHTLGAYEKTIGIKEGTPMFDETIHFIKENWNQFLLEETDDELLSIVNAMKEAGYE